MVVRHLLNAQLTGRGITSHHSVPKCILARQDSDTNYAVPSQLRRLSARFARRNVSGMKRALRRLLVVSFPQNVGLPHGFGARRAELMQWLNPERAVACRDSFIASGGIEVMQAILREFHSTQVLLQSDPAAFWDCSLVLNCALAICKEMCFHSGRVSARLAEDDRFVLDLFEHCREGAKLSPHPPKKFCSHPRTDESEIQGDSDDWSDEELPAVHPFHMHQFIMLPEESSTFDNSVGLLEELLAARRTAFDLSRVPHLDRLVASLDGPKLALFCGVLALVAFDPEERERDPTEANLALARDNTTPQADESQLDEDCSDDPATESTLLKAAWIAKMRKHKTPGQSGDAKNATSASRRTVDDNHRRILDVEGLAPRLISLLVNPERMSSEVHQHQAHQAHQLIHIHQLANMPENFSQQALDFIRSQLADVPQEFAEILEQMFHVSPSQTSTSDATTPEAGESRADSLDPVPEMSHLTTMDDESVAGAPAQSSQCSQSASHTTTSAPRRRRGANSIATVRSYTAGTHKVEVLFVMSCLMAGQHRNCAQDSMARLTLIPTLTRLFDALEWNDDHDDAQPHGDNCDCNPEASLKLQFLRLLHNFCNRAADNNHNKRLLISPKELAGLGLQRDLKWLHQQDLQSYKEDLEEGLMTRLVRTLLCLPENSPYRFWMALGIESFLRGADRAHQLFIARQGVFPYLVKNIVRHHHKKKEHTRLHSHLSAGANSAQGQSGGSGCGSERSKTMEGTLQTHFDLLGEMLKFNADAFRIFSQEVSDEQWILLRNVVTDNLVDSNVFVRAVVLSLERFDRDGTYPPQDRQRCRLSQFVTERQISLLGDLMICVSVNQLTPENICCLNTALTFFLLASTRQKAAHYIDRLARNVKYGRAALENFQHLLLFWRRYYSVCGNDSKSLEFSSSIPFSRWQQVVTMLMALAKQACTPESDHAHHVHLPAIHQTRLSQ